MEWSAAVVVLFVAASLVFVAAVLRFADLVSSLVPEGVCVAAAATLIAAMVLCVAPLVRFASNVLTVLACGFAFAYFVVAPCRRVAACYLYWRLLLLHM